jgi:DNA-binding response OmpR family regulator
VPLSPELRLDLDDGNGCSMGRLDERVILIAEDEPLLGLDIADSLRGEGANVISAHNVKDALTRAATEDLSAAVLDINLAGEDCT